MPLTFFISLIWTTRKPCNEILLRDHKTILTTYTTSPHLSIIINHNISQKEKESGFVPLVNEIRF